LESFSFQPPGPPLLGENKYRTEGHPRTPGRDESLHPLRISDLRFWNAPNLSGSMCTVPHFAALPRERHARCTLAKNMAKTMASSRNRHTTSQTGFQGDGATLMVRGELRSEGL
jgi:hypothetical protein